MYEAIVCRISIREFPNAKNLNLGTCCGYQVIVSKSLEDQTLGIFFPAGGRLAPDFVTYNNLYKKGKGPNRDCEASGYLDENRRVVSLKLRGEISEGIFLPLTCLDYIEGTSVKEGDSFTQLNGHLICEKYYSSRTYSSKEKTTSEKQAKYSAPQFKQHYETEQIRHHLGHLPLNARYIITEKLHGTSGRSANIPVTETKPLSWQKALWNKYFSWLKTYSPERETSYKTIYGTRRTVCYEDRGGFRAEAHKLIAPHLLEGETFYYEIVGYEQPGKPIMSDHHVDSCDYGNDLIKKYNIKDNRVRYSYGCSESDPLPFKIYVYRITRLRSDGSIKEYSWDEIKYWCRQFGLLTVPVEASVYGFHSVEHLLQTLSKMSNGFSTLDHHLKEGVCVRIETDDSIKVYKYKGFDFCFLENIKANEDILDTEDIS